MPFTADHVCEAVKRLYSGRVVFHDGEGQVADGVTVHCVGGHSRGLQCVRVLTDAGWLVLASDAAHYYENFEARKPFPIVVDLPRGHQHASTTRHPPSSANATLHLLLLTPASAPSGSIPLISTSCEHS